MLRFLLVVILTCASEVRTTCAWDLVNPEHINSSVFELIRETEWGKRGEIFVGLETRGEEALIYPYTRDMAEAVTALNIFKALPANGILVPKSTIRPNSIWHGYLDVEKNRDGYPERPTFEEGDLVIADESLWMWHCWNPGEEEDAVLVPLEIENGKIVAVDRPRVPLENKIIQRKLKAEVRFRVGRSLPYYDHLPVEQIQNELNEVRDSVYFKIFKPLGGPI